MKSINIYQNKIEEYIGKLELGDSFNYYDLLEYCNIPKDDLDKANQNFKYAFKTSKEFKLLTKIQNGHSRNQFAPILTKYMKT